MNVELERLREDINSSLADYLPNRSQIAQPIVDAMRHTVLGGGKRIRPMLVLGAAAAVGSDAHRALPIGCAIEFIHAYSLIHDDLPAMDDDDLRHGLPSAHIAFGEANAILAGDSLHSLAFQTITDAEAYDPATRLKMLQVLAEAAGWTGMAGGQCLDIQAEGKTLTLNEIKMMHSAKTGALITAAVNLGALCAAPGQCNPEQYALLTTYGERIGLAFQVMDDVLDVTSSTSELGKPAGSDAALEKNTFPKLMGVDEAKNLAFELVDEATSDLERTQLSCDLLNQLARLVVERKH